VSAWGADTLVSRTPVTRSAAQPAGAVALPGQRARWAEPVGLAIIGSALVALALRLYLLSRPGFLLGVIEYDDGTDFGSAVRLVNGALPYRDFIIVQPPGITLLMAPIALAAKGLGTAGALAIARVMTALASTAGVVLAGLLVRHRGLLATLVTCGLLAVYPDSVQAAKTVLLEPWLVLFCLLGALAVFDGDRLAGGWRRVAVGGLAFGFAGAVKVWAILPVAVILVLAARRPRQAGTFAAGVAAGFLVPVLPFAALAPRTFYDSVVIAQLRRVDLVRIPLGQRLTDMTGLSHLPKPPVVLLILVVAAVIGLSVGAAVLATRLTGQRPVALEWFSLVTAALVVAAFLWPSDFYYHYPAFLAPFLGMAMALPLARLWAALPDARLPRRLAAAQQISRRQPAALVWLAAAVLAVLTLLQGASESAIRAVVPPSALATARQLIKPGACVLSDQASYAMAVDRFVARTPGCSLMVDGVGTDYALSLGHNGLTGAGESAAVRAVWMSAFRAAEYVWLTRSSNRRIPWTPELRTYFSTHFVPLAEGPARIYGRRG
jgi:Glycosyltransferase family 87